MMVLCVLLCLNGVLAMSELAVMTSRRSRLQRAATAGSRGARAALELAEHPTRFLSTVQVGITLIGILAGAFGENQISGGVQALIERVPILARYADSIALVLVVLAITFLSLVLGELVPKRLALAFPEDAAAFIARPLRVASIIMAGPVRVLSWSTDLVLSVMRVKTSTGDDVSAEDVEAIVARAASTGVFTPREHELMKRVIDLGDTRARDLMVPRTSVVWLDADSSAEDVRRLLADSRHSHYPVCRESLDDVVGVVHIKDLLARGVLSGTSFNVCEIAAPPVFIPDATPVPRVLDVFKAHATHVAFVVDEYGGVQGLVTLNDVGQRLLGEVARPGEGAAQIVRRSDGSWLLDGRMGARDAIATLGIQEEPPQGVSTVAGLVIARLGRIPTETESMQWAGYRFEVVDMDGARIDKVLVVRAST